MERRREMQRSKCAEIGVNCHIPLKNTEFLEQDTESISHFDNFDCI